MLVKSVLDGLHGRERSRFSTDAYNKKPGLHKSVSDSIVFSIATMPSIGNSELAAFFAFVVTCVLWSLENRIL